MNLLNDSTEIQEDVPLTRQRVQSNKNNTLRQATIQAMSNLLSANIDSGLMHSIGQYHKQFISLVNLLAILFVYFYLMWFALFLSVSQIWVTTETCKQGQHSWKF